MTGNKISIFQHSVWSELGHQHIQLQLSIIPFPSITSDDVSVSGSTLDVLGHAIKTLSPLAERHV
jgi:hypothetical protein